MEDYLLDISSCFLHGPKKKGSGPRILMHYTHKRRIRYKSIRIYPSNGFPVPWQLTIKSN